MHRTEVPPELLVAAEIPQLLRYAMTDWLVIAVVWLVMWHSPWWVYPFGWLVIAGRFHALGVVVHDACHMRARTMTPSPELLDLVAGYPIATSVNAVRYHHLRHHRNNGMALDPHFKAGVSSRPDSIWIKEVILSRLFPHAPCEKIANARVRIVDSQRKMPFAIGIDGLAQRWRVYGAGVAFFLVRFDGASLVVRRPLPW